MELLMKKYLNLTIKLIKLESLLQILQNDSSFSSSLEMVAYLWDYQVLKSLKEHC